MSLAGFHGFPFAPLGTVEIPARLLPANEAVTLRHDLPPVVDACNAPAHFLTALAKPETTSTPATHALVTLMRHTDVVAVLIFGITLRLDFKRTAALAS